MKNKIAFTKADESSFDGTDADRYSADESALFSQHDAKPNVIRSVRVPKIGFALLFAWYDMWIGFFWDKKKKWLYVFPVPMFGFILKFGRTFKYCRWWGLLAQLLTTGTKAK